MKKQLLLTVFLMITLVAVVNSQTRRFGLRSGINMAKFRYSVTDGSDTTNVLGRAIRPNLGFILESGKISLQS